MRLLPREAKFYEFFLSQGKLISDAAQVLLDGCVGSGKSLEAAAKRISELEHAGDEIIHDVYKRLNETFITPIDPEDIHSLASHLDDVLDYIEDVAYRIHAYKVDAGSPTIVGLCEVILQCALSLERAFLAMQEDRPVLEHCVEVNRLEEVADQRARHAVRDLFDNEKDAIKIMKLKEVYELLEAVTDRCEDVADVLQNVAVKNS